MNDTSPWAEAKLKELYAARTPGERIAMACEMFTLAREMMIAGIRAESPDITPTELRLRLLDRLYAGDISPVLMEKVRAHIRATAGEANRPPEHRSNPDPLP